MAIGDKIKSANGTIMVGGIYDTMSAILVEEAKFDAIWISGLGLSVSKKGRPDASIISMSEIVETTYNISNVVSLPLIIDMDSGFGNAINVYYHIKELVKAGAAGVCIEDNIFPKSNSFYLGIQKSLVSTIEMQNKIKAAKDSSHDDFVVIARNESLIVGTDINEALDRSYAYEEAGADGLVVHSADWTLVEAFLERWKGKVSLVCIPTKMPHVSITELINKRFEMLIYANQALRASLKYSKQVLDDIIVNGISKESESKISSVKEVFDLVNMDFLSDLERRYL